MIQHYTAIANSVDLPIILYNVPSRTGVNILPQTAVTLAKNVKNIVAIKEASGNISQVAELAALADGCIEVNPIPVKEAMNMMGWNAGAVRSPLCEMEPQHKELLRKELAAMKLI